MDPFHVPIGFHKDIINEIATESGFLLVLARGLGLNVLMKSLVHLYADPKLLVFLIVGESDDPLMDLDEEKNSRIRNWNSRPTLTESDRITVSRTEAKFMEEGVIILSARVFWWIYFIPRIPIPLITGVMIQDAHKVSGIRNGSILPLFTEETEWSCFH